MKPYLSIVICGRNDNYGGDFIKRLQNFINWNTNKLEQNKVSTEIILVNWNPIVANISLVDLVNWPINREFVDFRIITVPPETHKVFQNEKIRKKLPLYEYLAKNVGIRRAKGDYILAMNPDILLPKTIVKKIARRDLNENTYYRANRIDYMDNFESTLRIWLKGYTYPLNSPFPNLRIPFIKIRNAVRCYWRKNSIKYEDYFKKKKWAVYYHNAEYFYHCNVSGDFMLMHKSKWHELKGNPEHTYLPLHNDAITVIMAAAKGLKEFVFAKAIYHQEHQRRFDATEKNNRENEKAYLYFQKEAQKMIKDKKASVYNDDNWGLRNFNLPEIAF